MQPEKHRKLYHSDCISNTLNSKHKYLVMSKVTGKVSQIIGPVVDVEFQSGSELPKIYDSLEIKKRWFYFSIRSSISHW